MPHPRDTWNSEFGAEYTDRNPHSIETLDAHYKKSFGITRTALNTEFLDGLPRDCTILEVGCNVGTQLRGLQSLGFNQLTGVELQDYAVRKAKQLSPELPFARADATGLPFADEQFDLVFTSGVLIHIPPDILPSVLSEIHRCSKRYIWGWEYFSEDPVEVPYRGQSGLLWKRDFARTYVDAFADVSLTNERHVPYLNEPNVDVMYLLEKGSLL